MDCYISSLTQEGLLVISGPDTLVFLQGQTSCDTSLISTEKALPGVYCTPQGRVVCDFLLLQIGEDSYGLRMRREIIGHAAATLGKYIVFSKADIDPEQHWQLTGLAGKDLPGLLATHHSALPTEKYAAQLSDAGVLVQMDDNGQRFEFFHQGAAGEELLAALEQHASTQAEEGWQAQEIVEGIARIEQATLEEFVPQTLNYDITGHISFSKGCYTGQEVVARLHYRGKPKRRSYACVAAVAASPGSELYMANNERSIGHVVNTALDADGRQLMLVAATTEAAAQGLHLEGPEGPQLTLLELPYSIPGD